MSLKPKTFQKLRLNLFFGTFRDKSRYENNLKDKKKGRESNQGHILSGCLIKKKMIPMLVISMNKQLWKLNT